QDVDHRVAQRVVGLHGGIDRTVGGECSLEGGGASSGGPAGSEGLVDQLHALGVRLACLLRDGIVAPDGLVVALREGDRVGVGVTPAVQFVHLRVLDVPARIAL